MATVIILNGISSAGKTTLAKAIQSVAEDDFLHVALDGFMAMLPDGRETDENWFPVEQVEHERSILPRIGTGLHGNLLIREMRAFVAALARARLNVVVDDVAHLADINDYRARLADARLLVVKVDAPLKAVTRREGKRGDRLIGLAREQSLHLHKGIDYDFEVNTESQAPAECAAAILTQLEN